MLAALSLTACASVELAGPAARAVSAPSLASSPALSLEPRPADEIEIVSTRSLRALRELRHANGTLELTGAAKIGLWVGVGVGVVALYHLVEETEDVFNDVVDCLNPIDPGCDDE